MQVSLVYYSWLPPQDTETNERHYEAVFGWDY